MSPVRAGLLASVLGGVFAYAVGVGVGLHIGYKRGFEAAGRVRTEELRAVLANFKKPGQIHPADEAEVVRAMRSEVERAIPRLNSTFAKADCGAKELWKYRDGSCRVKLSCEVCD